MGRAARAKQAAWARGESVQRGNPAPAPLRALIIDAQKFTNAPPHSLRRIAFSDRAYTMDERGQLRRLAPAIPPPAPTTTISFSNGEPVV